MSSKKQSSRTFIFLLGLHSIGDRLHSKAEIRYAGELGCKLHDAVFFTHADGLEDLN